MGTNSPKESGVNFRVSSVIKPNEFGVQCEYREIDAVKIADFDNEQYKLIHNAESGGISHSVWQEAFKRLAKKYGMEELGLEYISIQRAFKKDLGNIDVTRITFDFMGYAFKQAYVAIEPGKSYIFPKAVAEHINSLIESKTIDPSDMGFTEDNQGVMWMDGSDITKIIDKNS